MFSAFRIKRNQFKKQAALFAAVWNNKGSNFGSGLFYGADLAQLQCNIAERLHEPPGLL